MGNGSRRRVFHRAREILMNRTLPIVMSRYVKNEPLCVID
jgi:hypothetical protein